MAAITPTISRIETFGDRAHVITWATLTTTNNVGIAIEMPGSSDRSVQFVGTWGAGGSARLEGSNDGANYHPLTDPQGNDLIKGADDLEAVTELTRYVRPSVTAGDGTTDIDVSLLVKR